MVGEGFIERWVQRLRLEVPDAVAVFLVGSFARGDAGPHSDVDFDVLVADGPRDEAPASFDVDGGRLVYVSVWIRDVATWLDGQQEAQDWAFWLPSAEELRLCWVAEEWRGQLGRSQAAHPAGEPELDHFVGELGKVANAYTRGDELGLRLAAQDLARSCPSLLQPVNPRPPVSSRRAAMLAVRDFDVVPTGCRDDVLVSLGLTGRPTSAEDVYAAARRLATGVVELLESHAGTFTRLLPQQLGASLIDGSLRRYVAQLIWRAGCQGVG